MITGELMAQLKAAAKANGDEMLDAIVSGASHPYADLAVLAYMYHFQVAAVLGFAGVTADQRLDALALIDEVAAFAKAEADGQLRAMNVLREGD